MSLDRSSVFCIFATPLFLLLYSIFLNKWNPCPPYFPGFTSQTNCELVSSVRWDDADVVLQIELRGERFTFRYGRSLDSLTELCVADGALINPEKVGCMAGTMLGMFASGNGTDSDNVAAFDWFELK